VTIGRMGGRSNGFAGVRQSDGYRLKVISNIEPLAIDDDLLYLGELTAISDNNVCIRSLTWCHLSSSRYIDQCSHKNLRVVVALSRMRIRSFLR